MKQHNIVIAGRTDMIELLNQIATSLRGSARLMYAGNRPMVSVISDMESVRSYVEDDDVTTLIVSETISSVETGSDITISKSIINEWKTNYPDMLVILVVDSNKKGGVKLKNLYEEGYYNVLYLSDFKQHIVIDLIRDGGRDDLKAFKYYGLDQIGAYEPPKPVAPPAPKPAPAPEPEPEPVAHPAPKASTVPDDDYEEEARHERRRKKKRYSYSPMEEEDDEYVEPKRTRREPEAPPKPAKKIEEEYEEPVEEDEYEEEYEEEYEKRPQRRVSRRARRVRKKYIYPMPDDCRLYFGEVEDIDEEENLLIVKVPVSGKNVELDESFIGSQVFFVVSTDEDED